MTRKAALGGVAAAAAAGLAWGHFEAGWLRFRSREVALERLPAALDGVRIVHLSDFHLGVPSRGARAVERAVGWAVERDPELVLITGDLLSRPRGERRLRELVARLPRCYAVLGNHDYGVTRDPFVKRSALADLTPARLLVDEAETVDLRGVRVQIAGVDARSYRRGGTDRLPVADADAGLRILLTHFPRVAEQAEASFDLILSGHMHGGQITVPWSGGRKLRLAHVGARYSEGCYRVGGAVLHVSRGLGTTFVPFRFFARPEATELVLRRP